MLKHERPTYHELEQLVLQQSNRIKELVQFYDDYVGTPCEQIWCQREVERLNERIRQLKLQLLGI